MYVALLVLSVVIFIGAAVIYLRHPAASIFHPLTWYLAFHGLVFVVRPIFGWIYEYDSIYLAAGFTPSLWDKSKVLICTNLGFVTFFAVALAVAPYPIRFRQDQAALDQRQELLRLFPFVAIPIAVIASLSFYWIWEAKASGSSYLKMDMNSGIQTLDGTNGYFLTIGSSLSSIVAILAYLGRFRLVTLVPYFVFAILRLGTGGRGDFIAATVMLAILYLFDRQKKWPTLAMLPAALAAIVTFSIIGQDRGVTIRESFGLDVTNDIYYDRGEGYSKWKPLETMDLSSMEGFEYVAWAVPAKTGSYDYFLSNLQIFTEPIPRSLWPNKPIGSPIKLFDLYKYGKPVGMTVSVPGTGWFYMGYIGVLIWCSLFSLFYSTTYRNFCLGPQGAFSVIFYAILLSTSIVAYRDGTILTILRQIGFYFIPPVALALLSIAAKSPNASSLRHTVRGDDEAEAMEKFGSRRAYRMALINMAKQPSQSAMRTPDLLTPRERRRARIEAGQGPERSIGS